jgi:hypothetical protein
MFDGKLKWIIVPVDAIALAGDGVKQYADNKWSAGN